MTSDPHVLPAGLPVPQDDGACDHLGRVPYETFPIDPSLTLRRTDETPFHPFLSTPLPTVFFFYPRTGVPGQPSNRGFAGEDWDDIPGARGCTPQSCGFRDLHEEFRALNVTVYGVSTQTTEFQRAFKERNRIPFEFLSDVELRLTRAMCLPTFEFPVESGGPTTLIRRMAMLVEHRRIQKVWYPVFPSDLNAPTVLEWIRTRPERARRLGQELVTAACPRGGPDRVARVRPVAVVVVRPAAPSDAAWVREELLRNWGSTSISSRGVWFDAERLPSLVAERGGQRIGLVTFTEPRRRRECEIVTLSSRFEAQGGASALLDEVARATRAAGSSRLFLTTTNDNLRALGFYQRRGWRIAAVHLRAVDRAREQKPGIPDIAGNGVPIRDEIELELPPDRWPRPESGPVI